MNLEELKEIVYNNVEFLADSARGNSADESTVIGVAKYAIGNGCEKLSAHQKTILITISNP
ncbi:hypothetical protein [Halomonas salifodinae]|uniref:hypothetical protein n=1 Tax=Halomonas salifodinae TaxID=438745 RepID=UPI0033BE9A77